MFDPAFRAIIRAMPWAGLRRRARPSLRGALPALLIVGVALSLCAVAAAQGQAAVKTADAKPTADASQAYVIENKSTVISYENDGTNTSTTSFRVRIQSQAGVQQFGVLQFPYASATQTMEIVHVRVIKPDKSAIETPTENVVDMPADITRQAPFYSDLKVMQVAVKGLEAGDVLEAETRQAEKKPFDPGQFWNTYQFFTAGIVQEEDLELRIPKGRALQVKSATVQPTISEEGAYKVYRWKTANLQLKSASDDAPAEPERPSVEFTTFQNWDQLGQWLRSLYAPRAAATPDIQAKADELTRGAKTETEKIQDLYAFVSTKYRYIGIALGIGRVQPHAASDVLTNEYGDCKDKHTLFAALLAAEGIKAFPALINSQPKVEPDMPSPMQFDHVITAIPQGKGFLFLDTTPEVAPFGYLIPTLRDKQALVVPDSGPGELVTTPVDPPFPSFFEFRADGTLDSAGTLESKIQMTFRGDAEVIYRALMRQSNQAQWKDVMQQVSQGLGFGGTVSDVTADSPDATDVPYRIQYHYHREKLGNWDDKQIVPAFPPLFLPAAPDKPDKNPKPIDLGTPGKEEYQSTIQLPKGWTEQSRPAIHLDEDFAAYSATYSMTDGTLHVERLLTTKKREVPPGEIEAYRKFQKTIADDENTFIQLSAAEIEPTGGTVEAQAFMKQARAALQTNDIAGATEALTQAVEKDPKLAEAWMTMGGLHAYRGSLELGIEELKKAIALNPTDPRPYDILGSTLAVHHRSEEALAMWQGMEKALPENPDAPQHAGDILLDLKRYPEAVTELKTAVERGAAGAGPLRDLGTAYAAEGDKDAAASAFTKARAADSSDANLNDVAFDMADNGINLDDALKYAEQAVKDEEAATAKIDLNNLQTAELGSGYRLAADWDTLGWVHFRMGHFPQAEKYLNAAWRLSQWAVVGDHLGQLYEKEGKKQDAIKAYEQTVAAGNPPENTTLRLKILRPRASTSEAGTDPYVMALQHQREANVEVTKKPTTDTSAQVIILLAPTNNGVKVTQFQFVNGPGELRDSAKGLLNVRFDFPLPDDSGAQFLRTAVFTCDPYVPKCAFILNPLNSPVPMPKPHE